MRREYYWFSHEGALHNRKGYAAPEQKTVYRFKRSPKGNGFALLQKTRASAPIPNAPGYTTAVYLPTGDIIEFTESRADSEARPLYLDARFLGEFDAKELVILQHKDGFAARYQIGSSGLEERELTVYQAKWLEEACAESGIPMPIIDGYEPTLPQKKRATA